MDSIQKLPKCPNCNKPRLVDFPHEEKLKQLSNGLIVCGGGSHSKIPFCHCIKELWLESLAEME